MVITVTGTLAPLHERSIDAKVQVQVANGLPIPKSLMKNSSKRRIFRPLAVLAIVGTLPGLLAAQESFASTHRTGPAPAADVLAASELPAAPEAAIAPAARPALAASMFAIHPVEAPAPRREQAHRFWDRENCTLFGVSAGWSTVDFFVTRSNLASGGRELNPVARVFAGSNAGLAANFALETGGVIGISYIFHKTRHHKLERATSFVNISASAGAVFYGLAHH